MKNFQTIPENYKPVNGSYKEMHGYKSVGDLNSNEVIEVTIMIRRKSPIEPLLTGQERVSRKDYEEIHGAAEEDMRQIEQFAHQHNLTIVFWDCARRSVILRGRVKDFEQAFCVNLVRYYQLGGTAVFRGRIGDIHVPVELQPIIEGVFGLDNRPIARPMFQIAKKGERIIPPTEAFQSYTGDEVADIYGFPSNVTGKDQCIGIIELGGGYRAKDLKNYFKGLGIDKPNVKAISVDGSHNAPSSADSADGEVTLDIEVAGAVAPAANIVVYFTPNTIKGFLDAITKAVHDTQNNPSALSISWGAAEVRWTKQALNNFNEVFKTASTLGITICTATGDAGSSDNVSDGKVHVDFPSSSPYVLSCGGTKLETSNGKIQSEVVWNESDHSATGGGVSEYFSLPDYQHSANVPDSLNDDFKGRGLPDVAGNADPQTGYQILVDGQQFVIGGTSAVAPLMAGLVARANEQRKDTAGFINPSLYNGASDVRDITKGNNITTSSNLGYKAGKGWDACSGWGVLSKLPPEASE